MSVCMYECAPCAYSVPLWARRGHWILSNWSYRQWWATKLVMETVAISFVRQPVLLTMEPPFQLLCNYLWHTVENHIKTNISSYRSTKARRKNANVYDLKCIAIKNLRVLAWHKLLQMLALANDDKSFVGYNDW